MHGDNDVVPQGEGGGEHLQWEAVDESCRVRLSANSCWAATSCACSPATCSWARQTCPCQADEQQALAACDVSGHMHRLRRGGTSSGHIPGTPSGSAADAATTEAVVLSVRISACSPPEEDVGS